jgi:broad specificity phosphatase PhoE
VAQRREPVLSIGTPSGTIHLVRHGEVENPAGIIYGRLPGYNLSKRGIEQAEEAAEHLADRDIGAAWSSPLERTRETAEVIARVHDLDVRIDERLIESGNEFQGVGRSIRAFLRSPRLWWSLRSPWRPSWGESFSEIRKRMLEVVSDALSAADGREVVLVSHQTPVIVTRLALAERRLPPWISGVPCQTGSVTTIVLTNGKVTGGSYFVPTA